MGCVGWGEVVHQCLWSQQLPSRLWIKIAWTLVTLETQIATKLLVFPTVSNYTGYPCKTICNYVTSFSQFATTLAIPVIKFCKYVTNFSKCVNYINDSCSTTGNSVASYSWWKVVGAEHHPFTYSWLGESDLNSEWYVSVQMHEHMGKSTVVQQRSNCLIDPAYSEQKGFQVPVSPTLAAKKGVGATRAIKP